MAQTKNAPLKKFKAKTAARPALPDEITDLKVATTKKPIEFDVPEEPIALEEKSEDDAAAVNEESDELAGEEAGLDEEELNPFGDKWEQ